MRWSTLFVLLLFASECQGGSGPLTLHFISPLDWSTMRLSSLLYAAPRYLMCRPTFFNVTYSINPWMTWSAPVNCSRAMDQWETLREAIEVAGGKVDVMEPDDGEELPDLVFVANAAVVRGKNAFFANFSNKGETALNRRWFERDFASNKDVVNSTVIMNKESPQTAILLLQNGYQTKFVYMSEFESFDSIWPIIVLWTVFLSVSRHSRMTFLSLMPLLILFALFALTCDAARVKTTPKKGAAGPNYAVPTVNSQLRQQPLIPGPRRIGVQGVHSFTRSLVPKVTPKAVTGNKRKAKKKAATPLPPIAEDDEGDAAGNVQINRAVARRLFGPANQPLLPLNQLLQPAIQQPPMNQILPPQNPHIVRDDETGDVSTAGTIEELRNENNDDLNDNIMFDGVDPGAVGNEIINLNDDNGINQQNRPQDNIPAIDEPGNLIVPQPQDRRQNEIAVWRGGHPTQQTSDNLLRLAARRITEFNIEFNINSFHLNMRIRATEWLQDDVPYCAIVNDHVRGAYVSFPIRFEGAIRGLRIHGMGHITTCVDPFGERWAVARMITVQRAVDITRRGVRVGANNVRFSFPFAHQPIEFDTLERGHLEMTIYTVNRDLLNFLAYVIGLFHPRQITQNDYDSTLDVTFNSTAAWYVVLRLMHRAYVAGNLLGCYPMRRMQ